MAPPAKKPAPGVKAKRKPQTFVIDCAKPVNDKIMEIGTFEKYLTDKIKINNKTGEWTCLLEQDSCNAQDTVAVGNGCQC